MRTSPLRSESSNSLTHLPSLAGVGNFRTTYGAPAVPLAVHFALCVPFELWALVHRTQRLLDCPDADLLWVPSRSNGNEGESVGQDAELCSLRIRLPRPASGCRELPVRMQARSGYDRRDNEARTHPQI